MFLYKNTPFVVERGAPKRCFGEDKRAPKRCFGEVNDGTAFCRTIVAPTSVAF